MNTFLSILGLAGFAAVLVIALGIFASLVLTAAEGLGGISTGHRKALTLHPIHQIEHDRAMDRAA